jgi:hypothetical protein
LFAQPATRCGNHQGRRPQLLCAQARMERLLLLLLLLLHQPWL